MGYIVDLTVVLRTLFWRMRMRGGIQPVPDGEIQEIIKEFERSADKNHVHRDIRQFVGRTGLLNRADKDVVLAEVIQLINKYCLDPTEQVDT